MEQTLLPLFPLNVVLFPRTDLPLHIFEERYKEMIAHCLESGSEFGVVLVQERSMENTGCAAHVAKVVKRYDDGRIDIIARGSRRFEIVVLDQEKSYLRGEPLYFDDDDMEASALELSARQRAIELYRQAQQKFRTEGQPNGDPELDDEQLSYQIMARLPADLVFRQTLLVLRSEEERLPRVISYLEKLVAHLVLVTEARIRAGGNGKSH